MYVAAKARITPIFTVCSLVLIELLFANIMQMQDWVKHSGGGRRRARKRYADVYMRLTDEGRFDSITVLWPDGRAFLITEIVERGDFGPSYRGVATARYKARIRDHATNLFLERKVYDPTLNKPPVTRWWVEALG